MVFTRPTKAATQKMLLDLDDILDPKAIAARLGVVPDTIRKWYRGDFIPSLRNWNKLCKLHSSMTTK